MWIWRRVEHVKWKDKIKNAVVLEREGERRIMLELIKKRKRNWLGHWLGMKCLLKDALEAMVDEKIVRGRRKYQLLRHLLMDCMKVRNGRLRIR